MMQTNNTTIISRGQHLSLKERIEIQCMLSKDYSHRQIALNSIEATLLLTSKLKEEPLNRKKSRW